MIEKLERSQGSMVGYRVWGSVVKSDYAVIVPELEALVAEHGTVQLLCDLTDFKWEKASAWPSDMRFGHEFRHKISKMAIVGNGIGQKFIAFIADKFWGPEPSEYFDDIDAAWAWLSE
ncbi:MAG: STAS/SEC14 domain-containing protein [Candidatus Nanopelagicales bacterium]|nr:STAS/SEC14 domain-containing protein [Candidatus Nanopelagicales bacterium]